MQMLKCCLNKERVRGIVFMLMRAGTFAVEE